MLNNMSKRAFVHCMQRHSIANFSGWNQVKCFILSFVRLGTPKLMVWSQDWSFIVIVCYLVVAVCCGCFVVAEIAGWEPNSANSSNEMLFGNTFWGHKSSWWCMVTWSDLSDSLRVNHFGGSRIWSHRHIGRCGPGDWAYRKDTREVDQQETGVSSPKK